MFPLAPGLVQLDLICRFNRFSMAGCRDNLVNLILSGLAGIFFKVLQRLRQVVKLRPIAHYGGGGVTSIRDPIMFTVTSEPKKFF